MEKISILYLVIIFLIFPVLVVFSGGFAVGIFVFGFFLLMAILNTVNFFMKRYELSKKKIKESIIVDIILTIIFLFLGIFGINEASHNQEMMRNPRVKAAMDQIRAVAEIYKYQNGYYGNISIKDFKGLTCPTVDNSFMEANGDGIVLCKDIQSQNSRNLTIYSNNDSYCAQKELPNSVFWCIDNTGYVGEKGSCNNINFSCQKPSETAIQQQEMQTNKDNNLPIKKIIGNVDSNVYVGWNNYANNRDFEFKYPKNWIISDDNDSVKILDSEMQQSIDNGKNSEYGAYYQGNTCAYCYNIRIFFKPMDSTLEEYMTKNAGGYANVNKIEFAGENAYEALEMGMEATYNILVKKGNYLYEIVLPGYDKIPNSLKESDNQILFTFRFLK